MNIPRLLVPLASSAFILWLGLYVLTRSRGPRDADSSRLHLSSIFIGCACLLLSIYGVGIAMGLASTSMAEFSKWQRLTWWVSPFAVSCYLLALIALGAPDSQFAAGKVFGVLASLSLGFSSVIAYGITAGFFSAEINIHNLSQADLFFTRPRLPHYYIYASFIIGILGLAVVLAFVRWRQSESIDPPLRSRVYRLVAFSSLTMLCGTLIGVVWPGVLSRQLGLVIIMVGAGLMTFTIAQYHAFMRDRTVVRDFYQSMMGALLTLIISGSSLSLLLWIVGVHLEPLTVILIVPVILIIYAFAPWTQHIADRLTLPTWTTGYRRSLDELRADPLTVQNSVDVLDQVAMNIEEIIKTARRTEMEGMIETEIDHIFHYRRFDDDRLLAHSRLQTLEIVRHKIGIATASERQRADGLRHVVTHICENECAECSDKTDRERQIALLLLQTQYIKRHSRSEVEMLLHDRYGVVVRGGAYSRLAKKGRRALAQRVLEAETSLMARKDP